MLDDIKQSLEASQRKLIDCIGELDPKNPKMVDAHYLQTLGQALQAGAYDSPVAAVETAESLVELAAEFKQAVDNFATTFSQQLAKN